MILLSRSAGMPRSICKQSTTSFITVTAFTVCNYAIGGAPILVLSPRKRVRQDDCKSRKSSGKWQRDEGLAPDVMDLAKWCFGLGMRFHN